MTDAPIDFDNQEARCRRVLEQWTDPMGLGHWITSVTVYRDKQDYQTQTGASDGGIMMCDAAWHYLNAHLSVNLVRVAELDDARLEYALVHELCHMLVNEMREPDADGKHEERVVTQLAMAFRWVRNAAVDGRLPRVTVQDAEST